ncbi:DNA adenine methylase [Enterococcus cecorum]|uniref:DNA adenine methylase n=1 Tax=Enterococcus cecorum TaxID=44008 RepID=UPI001FADED7F|nr:DNA adenine methylase [Enterococcus cecorum]MCJ0597492.1 DNA adenine methylase [Enterococcus cecorum]
MATTTPLRYPGGKSKTYEFVRELINVNRLTSYSEVFAGGGGVAISLLLNDEVDKILLNDYDYAIYSFWNAVINQTDELIKKIQETDITMEQWYLQKNIYDTQQEEASTLDIGFATLFLNRTNRSGIIKAGVIGGKNQNGLYKLDCRFNKDDICKRIERIGTCRNRIKLSNKDAEQYIKQNLTKTKDTLIFLDPPYYKKGPALYTNFYNHDNHVSLAKTINKHLSNKSWILTYDKCDEINNLYAEYTKHEYSLNYSISKPSKGIEFLFNSDSIQFGRSLDYLNLLN